MVIAMVKKGDWGPVYCMDGPHKGRIGYYDNDGWDENPDGRNPDSAIVYWGHPNDCNFWSLVPRSHLTSKITVAQVMARQGKLRQQIHQAKSDQEKIIYLTEGLYVESLFYEKHIEGVYHPQKAKREKLFLSYNIENYKIASWLRVDLSNEGYEVWLDQWETGVGQSTVRGVNDAMAKCDFILLLLSKAALQSYWINKEWQATFMKEVERENLTVLPLLLEKCDIPKILKSKKSINFKNDYPRGFDQVLDVLQC